MLFALFPYDYPLLWTSPSQSMADYFTILENHLKFMHASPPLISRILNIVIGTGLLGFMLKLYKPSEANMLFDGASLVLYMCGITVYIANIVKGLRTVTAGAYSGLADADLTETKPLETGGFIGREDSLKVLAASNTILALILVGVLILQAGQWYAQRKEAEEIAEMDKLRDDKEKVVKESAGRGKKKQ